MGRFDKNRSESEQTNKLWNITKALNNGGLLALYLLMRRAGWPTPQPCKTENNNKESMMDETTFQSKLTELMGEISTLPVSERSRLETLAKETQERHRQLKKSINSLQDSLDWLRLSVKYMVFDLEATRRENQYLRQMLESSSEEGSL